MGAAPSSLAEREGGLHKGYIRSCNCCTDHSPIVNSNCCKVVDSTAVDSCCCKFDSGCGNCLVCCCKNRVWFLMVKLGFTFHIKLKPIKNNTY